MFLVSSTSHLKITDRLPQLLVRWAVLRWMQFAVVILSSEGLSWNHSFQRASACDPVTSHHPRWQTFPRSLKLGDCSGEHLPYDMLRFQAAVLEAYPLPHFYTLCYISQEELPLLGTEWAKSNLTLYFTLRILVRHGAICWTRAWLGCLHSFMVSSVPLETLFIWVVHWDESEVDFGGSSAYHLGTDRLNTAALENWDFLPLLEDRKRASTPALRRCQKWCAGTMLHEALLDCRMIRIRGIICFMTPYKSVQKPGKGWFAQVPWWCFVPFPAKASVVLFVHSFTGLDFSLFIEKQNQYIIPLPFTQYFSFQGCKTVCLNTNRTQTDAAAVLSQWRALHSTLERRVKLSYIFPCSFMGDSFIFNIFCLAADTSSRAVLSWLLQESLWVHNLPLSPLRQLRKPGSLGKRGGLQRWSYWKAPHIGWKTSGESANWKCSQPLC